MDNDRVKLLGSVWMCSFCIVIIEVKYGDSSFERKAYCGQATDWIEKITDPNILKQSQEYFEESIVKWGKPIGITHMIEILRYLAPHLEIRKKENVEPVADNSL